MEEFEEKHAIAAMRSAISPESNRLYDDDELLNVIDIIWDWYEDSGFLEIDSEDDTDFNEEDLINHVKKVLSKDKLSPIRPEDCEMLVKAELSYEQSLND